MDNEESFDFSNDTKEDLVSKYTDLEIKYKIDGTPEGFQNILGVFDVTSVADLIPHAIDEKYSHDWKKYCLIRRQLEEFEETMDVDERDSLHSRFGIFQQSVYYSNQTLMSFMRASNNNNAFPVPKSADMLFWYSPLDKNNMKPIHLIILYALGSLFRSRYRRVEGRVYQQIFLDSKPTHAWEDKCDIKDIIRSFCSKESNYTMWLIMTEGGIEPVYKYLLNCRDIEFPDLNVQRRVWSFNDGIYDATDDRFYFYDSPIDDSIVSCKIIRQNFADVYYKNLVNGFAPPEGPRKTYDDLDTPYFDSIFTPQDWDPYMIKWMFAFIGRLFYEVNERDSWQVIPFLKGIAGTGKSTVIKVIQLMYDAKDVGVISNNVEKKFGLSSVFDKTIFIIPELKGDFALDQAEFQSLVTGEDVSFAVKHENPIVGRWVVPGIIAGNESARWEDKSGSISRRIVVLNFPNKIPAEMSDPNLFRNITTELPRIIRKSSLAYDEMVQLYGNSDIWTALPARVREEKKKLQYSTNPLYAFMNSDRIEVDSEEYTLESIFISQLKIFANMKFPNISITFTEDFYSLIFSDFGMYVVNATKNWPRNSQNAQKQTYITGCKVIVG